MPTTYRAGNGKFVSKTNPVAVIARLNAQRQREAEDAARRVLQGRRRDAARNGYRGPLTRAEIGLVPMQRKGR